MRPTRHRFTISPEIQGRIAGDDLRLLVSSGLPVDGGRRAVLTHLRSENRRTIPAALRESKSDAIGAER